MTKRRYVDASGGPLGDGPLRLVRRKPGLTARAAGEKVGRSPRTIRRWSSIPRQEYLDNVQARREKVQKLYMQGIKPTQIIKETGIPKPTVYRYIQQLKASEEAS